MTPIEAILISLRNKLMMYSSPCLMWITTVHRMTKTDLDRQGSRARKKSYHSTIGCVHAKIIAI